MITTIESLWGIRFSTPFDFKGKRFKDLRDIDVVMGSLDLGTLKRLLILDYSKVEHYISDISAFEDCSSTGRFATRFYARDTLLLRGWYRQKR